MIDAGNRAILDRKGERGFGVEAERQRGADRPAMGHGDDVTPVKCLDQPVDRPRHPLDDGEKALAARGGLMCWGMPEAMEIAGTKLMKVFVSEVLPLAEILLCEIIDCDCLWAGDPFGPGQAGSNDCCCGFVGAAQIARHPDRVAR